MNADLRAMKLARLVGPALIATVAAGATAPVAAGAAVPIKRIVIKMPDPLGAAAAAATPQPAARPKTHAAKHPAVHRPSAH